MADLVVSCHSVDHWNEVIGAQSNSNKVVVVDFTASWCGPCRFIAPVLADLAKKHQSLLFVKVDVDELKTVAEKYKVDAMPTFVFLKNGEEIDRVVGARKEALVELVVKHSTCEAAPPADKPEETEEEKIAATEMAEQVIDCRSVDHWKELFETAKTSGKLVVVDFTATWCGPCRMIAPFVAELAKEHTNVTFLKVDVDALAPISQEYKINAMPSFVFLKNGEEIDRFLGAKKDTLANLVVKHSTSSSAI